MARELFAKRHSRDFTKAWRRGLGLSQSSLPGRKGVRGVSLSPQIRWKAGLGLSRNVLPEKLQISGSRVCDICRLPWKRRRVSLHLKIDASEHLVPGGRIELPTKGL